MAETVRASIAMPTTARRETVYALDETGQRSKVVPSTLEVGRLTFHVKPQGRFYGLMSRGRGA
jgi:hypothetical protein